MAIRGLLRGANGPQEIAELIKRRRKQLVAQVHLGTQMALLAAYQGVSDADLRQYAKELNSEPLKYFYSQLKECMLEMMEERSQAAGEDLRSILGEKQS